MIGPLAAELLHAVHSVRGSLDADPPIVRHLTQALAATAGVPAQAAPWRPDSPLPDADVMRAVHDVMGRGLTLRLDHLQQDGRVRTIDVEPYHVRLETGFWYLVSRLTDDGAETTLRLDRIMSAEPGAPFEPRPVDLDRYLDGVFVPGESDAVATVRFGPSSAVYAMERWGDGRPTPDGGVELDIPYMRDHYLVRSLAQFGEDFEVIAPEAVRAGVRDRARATLATYGDRETGA
jgi:predicted DNA-binding transcriptional regulator YafY